MLRGIIFDLDGTLVDSHLDFDAMRREMQLPPGTPILEALEKMPDDRASGCRRILQRHEFEGAQRATIIDGVCGFLERLSRHGIRRAIVTRNSRAMTDRVLTRLGLRFDPVITRDDGPVKPDPWAILRICQLWQTEPSQVAIIGDFRFDIDAGRRAGAVTVLLRRGRNTEHLAGAEQADFLLESFHDCDELWTSLMDDES